MSVNEKEIGIKNFEKFISKNTGMQLNASLSLNNNNHNYHLLSIYYLHGSLCTVLYWFHLIGPSYRVILKVYKQQRIVSHYSGGWEDDGAHRSHVQWGPSSSLMAVQSLCPHLAEGDKVALWGLFYKGSNLIHGISALMS